MSQYTHHTYGLLIILAVLATYSLLFCSLCHHVLSRISEWASHLQKKFQERRVWRQGGVTCVRDWLQGFWSLKAIRSGGTDRLHGSRKEERRSPSSRWWLGVDDRGWLLCGNSLHTSCHKVNFAFCYEERTTV